MLKIHYVDFVEYSLSLLSVTFVNFCGKLDFVSVTKLTSVFADSTATAHRPQAQPQMFF